MAIQGAAATSAFERRARERQLEEMEQREREQEAARARVEANRMRWANALKAYENDPARIRAQQMANWESAVKAAATQKRVLTVDPERYDAFLKLYEGWNKQQNTSIDAALMVGVAKLYGPYGTARSPQAANSPFFLANSSYQSAVSHYFAMSHAKVVQQRIPARVALQLFALDPAHETDPKARLRASLCVLAIALGGVEPHLSVTGPVRESVARMVHRALASQHAVLAARTQPVKDPWTSGDVWLDAGTARILWDAFADQPDYAPCAEIKADLLRLFREAEDPISHEPADFFGAKLKDWPARGVLSETSPSAVEAAVLEQAARLALPPYTKRLEQVTALVGPAGDRAPRDPGLADLCRSLVSDQLAAAKVSEGLIHLMTATLTGCFRAGPADPEFARRLQVFTRLASPATPAAERGESADALTRWLARSPEDWGLRNALAVLAINDPAVLDRPGVAEAALRAVVQQSEMRLIVWNPNQSPLYERYRAGLTGESFRKHPLFWVALTGEQLQRPDEAADLLLDVSPATPAVVDYFAALATRLKDNRLDLKFDTNLAALALPAEQRTYSRPLAVLIDSYDQLLVEGYRATESDEVKAARTALAAAATPAARRTALARLVALQRAADAANVPNEKALGALAAAAAKDPDGGAAAAYFDALRSAQAWMPVAAARRQAAGNVAAGAALAVRFGSEPRAIEGWTFLLMGVAKNAAWARTELSRRSLPDARAELRELIGREFNAREPAGQLIVQAYFASQTAADAGEWHGRLARLQPVNEARPLVQLALRGATEPWTTPGLAATAAAAAQVTENEASLDCLVGSVFENPLGPENENPATPPAFYWGKREALEALAELGPRLKKPRAWSDADFGHFSPACLAIYFSDLLANHLGKSAPVPAAPLVAKLPLDEVIRGADSMMRGREKVPTTTTLAAVRDFNFGRWLLTVALAKVPEGAALGERLINEEIGPAQLIDTLRARKVLN